MAILYYWINYPPTKEATQWKESFPPNIGKSNHCNHINNYVEVCSYLPENLYSSLGQFNFQDLHLYHHLYTNYVSFSLQWLGELTYNIKSTTKKRDVIVHSLEKAFILKSEVHNVSMQEPLTSNMVYVHYASVIFIYSCWIIRQSQQEFVHAPMCTRHASSPAIQLWINMHSVCANTNTDLWSSIFVRTFSHTTFPCFLP